MDPVNDLTIRLNSVVFVENSLKTSVKNDALYTQLAECEKEAVDEYLSVPLADIQKAQMELAQGPEYFSDDDKYEIACHLFYEGVKWRIKALSGTKESAEIDTLMQVLEKHLLVVPMRELLFAMRDLDGLSGNETAFQEHMSTLYSKLIDFFTIDALGTILEEMAAVENSYDQEDRKTIETIIMEKLYFLTQEQPADETSIQKLIELVVKLVHQYSRVEKEAALEHYSKDTNDDPQSAYKRVLDTIIERLAVTPTSVVSSTSPGSLTISPSSVTYISPTGSPSDAPK